MLTGMIIFSWISLEMASALKNDNWVDIIFKKPITNLAYGHRTYQTNGSGCRL